MRIIAENPAAETITALENLFTLKFDYQQLKEGVDERPDARGATEGDKETEE